MNTTKEQLHALIDVVDVSEHSFILHFLMKLVPTDDAMPDEIEAMQKGLEEIKNGEYFSHGEIDWDNLDDMDLD